MTVQFRSVRPGDLERIHNLIQDVLPVKNREEWISYWRWLHQDNPWLRKEIPVGFVACDGDHIVGHLGLNPVPVSWNGREVICQSSETFAVDPAYQGRGIGHELASRAWDSHIVPQPVSFTASAISTHLFAKHGGKAAPAVVNSIRIGILDIDAFLHRLQSKAGMLRRTTVIPGIALPARLIARWFLKVKMRRIHNVGDWSIEPIDIGHPLIEDLCMSSPRRNSLGVSVTPDYINWRYERAPLITGESYHTMSIGDRSRYPRAIAVLGEHIHSDWNGVMGDLMELVLDPEVDLLRVLACLITYGRSRNWVAFRSAFVSPEWDHTCRRAGMVRHWDSTSERTVVKPIGILQDTSEAIEFASSWNLGMGCRL